MAIERPTKIRDTIAVFPDKTYIFVPDLEHTQGIEFSDIVHLVDYHIVPFREREQIYARIRKYQ